MIDPDKKVHEYDQLRLDQVLNIYAQGSFFGNQLKKKQDILIFKVKLFWEKRKRERKYQLINWKSMTDLYWKSLTD